MAQCGKAGKDWLAPVLFTGTCDHKIVEHWLEHCLFKELTKPSLIIADNAPFHRKTYLTELAKQHGHHLLFLPPYSPDFNPIEQSFAVIKRQRLNTTTDAILS